jgi:hypothetical protein
MANHSIHEIEIENPYCVPIEIGDVICPKCKGLAYEEPQQGAYSSCDRCWGDGKLDWIELVMGKEIPCAMSGVSASSSRSSSSSSVSRQTTKRRKVNGSNSKPGLGTVQRFFKVFNKSQRSL